MPTPRRSRRLGCGQRDHADQGLAPGTITRTYDLLDRLTWETTAPGIDQLYVRRRGAADDDDGGRQQTVIVRLRRCAPTHGDHSGHGARGAHV